MIMVMTFASVQDHPHSVLRACLIFPRDDKASDPRTRARKLPPSRRRDASFRRMQFSRALICFVCFTILGKNKALLVIFSHSFMLLLLWSKISYYSHNGTSSRYVSLTRITFWCKKSFTTVVYIRSIPELHSSIYALQLFLLYSLQMCPFCSRVNLVVPIQSV